MKLTRFTKLLALAVVATTSAMFTGCSSDDEPIANYDGNEPMSRASVNGTTVTIDFENVVSQDYEDAMAGPTSYGLNYYYNSGYTQVTGIFDNDADMMPYFASTLNTGSFGTSTAVPSFMYGGIALSDWAITSNPSTNPNPGKPFNSEWWYSEYNQMSVYNTARTATGNRGGAGAGGSDNFGIVYGFADSYGYTKDASFELPMGAATLKSLKVCNTAYTYGAIQNGNTWTGVNGVVIKTKPLKDSKGYFELIIKCYDGSGNLVKRVETPLADYRNGKNFCITTWTEIPINASNVEKVEFGLWGSDIVEGGLQTPAYVAIDDIVLEL